VRWEIGAGEQVFDGADQLALSLVKSAWVLPVRPQLLGLSKKVLQPVMVVVAPDGFASGRWHVHFAHAPMWARAAHCASAALRRDSLG
jgi:hypothetical protein